MKSIIEWLFGVDTDQAAGAKNWRVDFISDYGNYINLALLLAFVAMVYLTVRSYRREGDAPMRKKAVLAAIRIAAIVLLFVIVLRPAIVLNFERILYRTVVVAIDDSQSMSFKDHYTDEELRRNIADSIGVDPVNLEDLSRLQVVTKALTGGENVLAELARSHRLVLLRFSTDKPGMESYTRQLAVIDPPDDDEDIDARMKAIRGQIAEALQSMTASGFETNMAAALRDALESVRGMRVAGIVMVSDGQNTSSDSQQHMKSANDFARERGVSVYSVVVGDPTQPKNISVTALRSPREVRVGSVAEFAAVISHRNLKGQTVKLHLYSRKDEDGSKWADTGVSEDVVLDGEDEESGSAELDESHGLQTVRLSVTPEELGDFVYKVAIEPRSDEQNQDDNEAETSLKVLDKQINVLLIGGDAGWEFQYLRNFLYRQSDLYRVSVWQQDADAELNQMASSGMKLSSLPRELIQLIGDESDREHKPGYDVVILYDPQPTEGGFDKFFCEEILQKYVDEGGGLCYIAGNKYSEAVMDNKEYLALAEMLPVVLAPNEINLAIRVGQTKPEAWPVQITPYGLDHQVVRLGSTAKETEQIFNALPGIYWSHPVAKVKPAARVLAVSSNPMRRTAKGEPGPLIVTQSYGGGKVLYIGFEDTWRWRFVRDGFYHRQFWGNVVRYLASNIRRVVITVGGDRFSAGEKITIEADARDKNLKPITEENFNVKMVDVNDRNKATTITLNAVPNMPGKFRTTITATATGAFELTAPGVDPNSVETKRIIIELPQAEAKKSESDPAVMQGMATRKENFMWVHDVDKLSGLIPSGRFTTVQEMPMELWDSKAMLVLVVVLLAVELIIRKQNNMA